MQGQKMKKNTKNDWILIVAVLVAALALWIGIQYSQEENLENGVAIVTIDGEVYGQYPLNQDMTKKIEVSNDSYNVLVIKNGEADITEASCPDKVCVDHHKINKSNQSIVCLPNKVVVTIENAEAWDVDSVTH